MNSIFNQLLNVKGVVVETVRTVSYTHLTLPTNSRV